MAKSTEQLNVQVPTGTNDALQERARAEKTTKSALVNRAIAHLLAVREAGDSALFD